MESILTSARESALLGGRGESAEILGELQVVEKFLGRKQLMAPRTCLGIPFSMRGHICWHLALNEARHRSPIS